MQRVWMVTPDRVVVTAAGEQLEVVSQEALLKALMDAGIVVDRLGGCVFLQVNRVPTGVPGEMATVLGQVVWKDRTDTRPQPEHTGTLTGSTSAAASVQPTGRLARIERLAERDGWLCHLCDELLAVGDDGDRAITVIHLVPRSAGGGGEDDNIRLAHWVCNNARGNGPLVALPRPAPAMTSAAVDEAAVPAGLREGA